MVEFLLWDIYEISSQEQLHGVKLRGKIRKKALELQQNILVENATDAENTVRLAVLSAESIVEISQYLKTILTDVSLKKVATAVKNPVLSKMKVNITERYE